MKITPLKISGAYLLEMQPFADDRGTFARQFCKREMAEYGIDFDIKQCNLSKNYHVGVLRGMHYQKEPYPEIKMVSCFKGRIYDVLVDLRRDSPTYKQWVATELSDKNGRMVYVPAGVAHGFQVLQNNSYVYYQLGEFFMPEHYDGVRWNDPAFGIKWHNLKQLIMNKRDQNYALWR